MSSSASSSQPPPANPQNQHLAVLLSLIPCPFCGAEVISFICRKVTRPGVRFYKCTHFNAGICQFFEWQEEYAVLLEGVPAQAVGQPAPVAVGADAAQPAQDLQQHGGDALAETEHGAGNDDQARHADTGSAAHTGFHPEEKDIAICSNCSCATEIARISLVVSLFNLILLVILLAGLFALAFSRDH